MSEQRSKTQAWDLLKILKQSYRPLADLEDHGVSDEHMNENMIARLFQSSGDLMEKNLQISTDVSPKISSENNTHKRVTTQQPVRI